MNGNEAQETVIKPSRHADGTGKTTIPCETCGKLFVTWIRELEKGRGKYCSRACYWQAGRKERVCKHCGNHYSGRKSTYIRGREAYCSRECYISYKKISYRGEQNHRWKPRIALTCTQCGKEYFKIPSVADKSKFCSRKCQGIWVNKTLRFKSTSIEDIIEMLLKECNLFYQRQVDISNIGVVDFLLPNKIVIECDGLYWHDQRKEADKVRNELLASKGFLTIRLSEETINEHLLTCKNLIKEAIWKQQQLSTLQTIQKL
jgi:very-short-patch-repair endonuclease